MNLEKNKTYYKVGDFNIGKFEVGEIHFKEMDGENYTIYLLKSDDKNYLDGKMLFDTDVKYQVEKGLLVETEQEANAKMIEIYENHIKDEEYKIQNYRNCIENLKNKIDEKVFLEVIHQAVDKGFSEAWSNGAVYDEMTYDEREKALEKIALDMYKDVK